MPKKTVTLPHLTCLATAHPVSLPPRPVGYGGRDRIIRDVEDPETGKLRPAVVAVRPRGVEDMWTRGNISDVQHATAVRFAGIFERAHSGGLKATRYDTLRVDGGGRQRDPLSLTKMQASSELAAIEAAVGAVPYAVLVIVCALGKSVREAEDYVPANDNGRRLGRRRTSPMLKAALDDLDAHWHRSTNRSATRAESYGDSATMVEWNGAGEANDNAGRMEEAGQENGADPALRRR